MHKTFTGFSRKKIRDIHALSLDFNEKKGNSHERVMLDLMREHVLEIEQLYALGDKHYLVETGDLLILCLELLAEAKTDPDLIMDRCYNRYNKKISGLIEKDKLADRKTKGR